jgi:hypothetical protein
MDSILIAGKIFELVHWKYYESIPVCFLAAAVLRAAVKKIDSIFGKHNVNLKSK